jgi:hypothetical protein
MIMLKKNLIPLPGFTEQHQAAHPGKCRKSTACQKEKQNSPEPRERQFSFLMSFEAHNAHAETNETTTSRVKVSTFNVNHLLNC